MKQLDKDLAIAQTVVLITSYSFDLQGYTLEELISKWLKNYHSTWIRLATIEALYLGRYKAISVEQIMGVWERLGEPKIHFGGEFERLICRKLPRHLVVEQNSHQNLKDQSQTHSLRNSITLPPVPESEKKPIAETSLPPTASISDETNPQSESQAFRENTSSPSQADSPDLPIPEPTFPTQELIPTTLNGEASKSNTPKSIEGFTPIPDMSSLYHKLKAIAEHLPTADPQN